MKRLWLIGIGMLVIFFGGYTGVNGQVNTEKFRKHYTDHGFVFNAGFRMGYSGGNSEYLSVDGTARVDYNGQNNDAFLVSNYDYKESNTEKITHKGFVHLRGIRELNSHIALEAFVQQEFNEFLLLEDRKLAGAGGRFMLINYLSEEDSLTGFRSNLGTGFMYEREVYTLAGEEPNKVIKEPIRFTGYLTVDWAISNRVTCWAIGYYQPNLARFSDFRSIVETGMEIWVIGKLYFTIDLSYRYNNEPVGPVKNYDLIFKNGLRLTIP